MEVQTTLEFKDLCRLCISYSQTSVDIFPTGNGPTGIASKIADCLSLQVWEEDVLPTKICIECLVKVETFCEFKEACYSSDSTLRSYYSLFKSVIDLNGTISLKSGEVEEPGGKESGPVKGRIAVEETPRLIAPTFSYPLHNTTPSLPLSICLKSGEIEEFGGKESGPVNEGIAVEETPRLVVPSFSYPLQNTARSSPLPLQIVSRDKEVEQCSTGGLPVNPNNIMVLDLNNCHNVLDLIHPSAAIFVVDADKTESRIEVPLQLNQESVVECESNEVLNQPTPNVIRNKGQAVDECLGKELSNDTQIVTLPPDNTQPPVTTESKICQTDPPLLVAANLGILKLTNEALNNEDHPVQKSNNTATISLETVIGTPNVENNDSTENNIKRQTIECLGENLSNDTEMLALPQNRNEHQVVECLNGNLSNDTEILALSQNRNERQVVECLGRDLSRDTEMLALPPDRSSAPEQIAEFLSRNLSHNSQIVLLPPGNNERQTIECLGRNLSHDTQIVGLPPDNNEGQIVTCLGRDLSNDTQIMTLLPDNNGQVVKSLSRNLSKDTQILAQPPDNNQGHIIECLGKNLSNDILNVTRPDDIEGQVKSLGRGLSNDTQLVTLAPVNYKGQVIEHHDRDVSNDTETLALPTDSSAHPIASENKTCQPTSFVTTNLGLIKFTNKVLNSKDLPVQESNNTATLSVKTLNETLVVENNDSTQGQEEKAAGTKNSEGDKLLESGSGSKSFLDVQCLHCPTTLESKEQLLNHIQSIHKVSSEKPDRMFPCTKCGKRYRRNWHLLRHLRTFHTTVIKRADLICPICSKQCKRKDNLNDHLQSHKKLTCSTCGITFKLRQDLVQHTCSSKLVCPICNLQLSTKTLFLQHTNSNCGKDVAIVPPIKLRGNSCRACKLVFDDYRHLQKHREEKHSKVVKVVEEVDGCIVSLKENSSSQSSVTYVPDISDNVVTSTDSINKKDLTNVSPSTLNSPSNKQCIESHSKTTVNLPSSIVSTGKVGTSHVQNHQNSLVSYDSSEFMNQTVTEIVIDNGSADEENNGDQTLNSYLSLTDLDARDVAFGVTGRNDTSQQSQQFEYEKCLTEPNISKEKCDDSSCRLDIMDTAQVDSTIKISDAVSDSTMVDDNLCDILLRLTPVGERGSVDQCFPNASEKNSLLSDTEPLTSESAFEKELDNFLKEAMQNDILFSKADCVSDIVLPIPDKPAITNENILESSDLSELLSSDLTLEKGSSYVEMTTVQSSPSTVLTRDTTSHLANSNMDTLKDLNYIVHMTTESSASRSDATFNQLGLDGDPLKPQVVFTSSEKLKNDNVKCNINIESSATGALSVPFMDSDDRTSSTMCLKDGVGQRNSVEHKRRNVSQPKPAQKCRIVHSEGYIIKNSFKEKQLSRKIKRSGQR